VGGLIRADAVGSSAGRTRRAGAGLLDANGQV
jgi:hypothetical protein